MTVQWIDDEEPNNSSALWSHEWGASRNRTQVLRSAHIQLRLDKHGTCAVNLPSLANQHDFFSEVLNIHSQVDIYVRFVLRLQDPA